MSLFILDASVTLAWFFKDEVPAYTGMLVSARALAA